MPNYEYQCKKCGHVFEREHAIGDKIRYRCPECSCSQTQKLISAVGVIFKGTGFYATDHRNGNGNGTKPAAKTTAKTAKAKSEPETGGGTCPASEN